MVAVELKPNAKQSDLVAALEPVADRLHEALQGGPGGAEGRARSRRTRTAVEAAQDELDALILFKSDMGAFLRLYTFLSQIFDYGNTAIEKRVDLLQARCCRCWSSAASARGSTSRRSC